jgi:hypothetical protein
MTQSGPLQYSIALSGSEQLDASLGHVGTTYGNLLSLRCLATDGFNPEGTAVPATRDSITSGALSASVPPLRVVKPYVAGVPTT